MSDDKKTERITWPRGFVTYVLPVHARGAQLPDCDATNADLAAAGCVPASKLAEVTAKLEAAEKEQRFLTGRLAAANTRINELWGVRYEDTSRLQNVSTKLVAAEWRVRELEGEHERAMAAAARTIGYLQEGIANIADGFDQNDKPGIASQLRQFLPHDAVSSVATEGAKPAEPVERCRGESLKGRCVLATGHLSACRFDFADVRPAAAEPASPPSPAPQIAQGALLLSVLNEHQSWLEWPGDSDTDMADYIGFQLREFFKLREALDIYCGTEEGGADGVTHVYALLSEQRYAWSERVRQWFSVRHTAAEPAATTPPAQAGPPAWFARALAEAQTWPIVGSVTTAYPRLPEHEVALGEKPGDLAYMVDQLLPYAQSENEEDLTPREIVDRCRLVLSTFDPARQPPAGPGTPLTVELMVATLRGLANKPGRSVWWYATVADELERAQKGVE